MKWAALGVLSYLILPCYSIWPFPDERFSGNSLVDAGSRGIVTGERAIAFGDFNGDQFMDILMLGEDQQTLTVYLWNHGLFEFVESTSFKHPLKIQNVVPGDFTHSGKLDILVMAESASRKDVLEMVVYPSLATSGFDTSNPLSVPPSTTVQPIPIDLDGDMKTDLLGVYADSSVNLKAWQNVWDSSKDTPELFSIIDPSFADAQCTLANPHSNAVIDLDGDCLADVFLVCDNGWGKRSFQIWTNQKDKGFKLSQTGSLPDGVQAISFADINRDGTIDMVFPTCSSVNSRTGLGTNCFINIVYNNQLPLCATATEPTMAKGKLKCRSPNDLCLADPNFKFDMGNIVRFPVSDLVGQAQLLVQDTTLSPPVPLPIKLGDANLDGFTDFLFIAGGTPRLAYSVNCGKGVAGCTKDGKGARGWEVESKGMEALDDVKDARNVAFMDMDEDGTLDVMVQRKGNQKILFVQNNFYYDAFFLKAIVLNGACNNGGCYGPNDTAYDPFGVSYSGASYKYTLLDTTGRRAAAQIGQLPQTSYQSLQTPYSFFGLGRTNNYIENLFIGSTVHLTEHFINIEGVIPNSKVVILPSAKEGEIWKRELFLRPGKWIPWVTVTVVVGMALLAIIVFILHLSEKREDELERRRVSHHINFDAL
ncbi:hypothetical protein CYLTODRAFT_374377 [Cylindrobasidium torrendii FP15055 ss-10]|uniref:T-cell immunomodulatory protein TIP C2 domain-containing protein n=1 Tax=Cylindrobasidium torrendii FP15055 ss-10 TaxID=1314674 RepID=A0A0D7BFK7_9AGAR|nr:hypothetical protein CYLTODRAFT_374377 [Cylindrobasidium torrendii FP15055 ss-10]